MAIQLAAIMGGALGGMGIAGLFPPLTRSMQHTLNKGWRNEILAPPQAIEGWYRGLLDPDQLANELNMMGINDERREWLQQLNLQLFGVIETIILWRREEIDATERDVRLKKVGIADEDLDLWVKFTETRPNVSDIIRFAVREVYSPQIAETYQLFEGADEVAATAEPDLRAAGIRPEDLRKHWGAHWVLPALNMGYEMLHRGVIDDAELMTLMRTLDIMPYWREKLVEISYNPLTRVDVRRMHKVGTLSDAELLRAYQNVGYNLENAQRMTDFTIAYNADPNDSEKTATDKERDLTKADIIKGVRDGLFTEQEGGDALMTLGYSQEEVDYYFTRVAFEKDRDEINTYLKAYRAAYLGNTMTHNEISDALNRLNLTGKRVENLFNIWDIEKSVRVAKPTKSEVLMFLRKKIIDVATATAELAGMGYNETYVQWYLQTA